MLATGPPGCYLVLDRVGREQGSPTAAWCPRDHRDGACCTSLLRTSPAVPFSDTTAIETEDCGTRPWGQQHHVHLPAPVCTRDTGRGVTLPDPYPCSLATSSRAPPAGPAHTLSPLLPVAPTVRPSAVHVPNSPLKGGGEVGA